MTSRSSSSTHGGFDCLPFGKIAFLVCLSLFSQSATVTAFTFVHRQTAVSFSRTQHIVNSLLMESEPTPPSSESTTPVYRDSCGKEITLGAVVRVSTEGLFFFQIAPKAQGSYDEEKQFVPLAPEEATTATTNLILPVGLRGIVTKVYDMDVISANYPVQVKFQPGVNVEEGYEAPVRFLMHFLPEELECV